MNIHIFMECVGWIAVMAVLAPILFLGFCLVVGTIFDIIAILLK